MATVDANSSFVKTTELPPARPHGALEPIAENVWYLEGTTKLSIMEFPRGMIVCREPSTRSLTLIQPIRLAPEGEEALLNLGEVTDLVRIGLHGMDVAYYQSRLFSQCKTASKPPAFWSFKGMESDLQHAKLTNVLAEHGPLPPALKAVGAKMIMFNSLPEARMEAALLFPTSSAKAGNVLVVGDSLQSHSERKGNFWMRNAGPIMGFKGKCVVGPVWKKLMQKEMEHPGMLKKDMERVLEWEFKTMLSGHGSIRDGTAHECASEAIRVAFAKEK